MTTSPSTTEPKDNREVVRRLYEECINLGKMELLPELVSDDFVADGQVGVSGFANNVAGLRTGFPDIHFTLEDMIAAGDRVVVRWKWRGTHAGPFRGLPASHKPITNTGIVIYQVRDGRVVRAWLETDRLGALQQMGAVPAFGPPPAKPAPREKAAGAPGS